MQLRYPFSEHVDKLDWRKLSENPNAISLLEENIDKIHNNYCTVRMHQQILRRRCVGVQNFI